ncbi:MAG: hypothetical protein UT24_C0001G0083, partial [Candidatus Woesebacteria bacterium GW2011_GWB1_39_12]
GGRRGSNPQPQGPQPRALPLSYDHLVTTALILPNPECIDKATPNVSQWL